MNSRVAMVPPQLAGLVRGRKIAFRWRAWRSRALLLRTGRGIATGGIRAGRLAGRLHRVGREDWARAKQQNCRCADQITGHRGALRVCALAQPLPEGVCSELLLVVCKEHTGAPGVSLPNRILARSKFCAYHSVATGCADRCHRVAVPFTRDLITTLIQVNP
jgi:hypothetical protein